MEAESKRIDIPEGHGRYWFDCVRDSNGQIIKILLVIGRSKDHGDPGTVVSEKADDVEQICSFEINGIESVQLFIEKLLRLLDWMREYGYAEQEGHGAGDDLATEQDG